MKKWIERFTGWSLGVNPIFTFFGLLFLSFGYTRGIKKKIASDRMNLYFWAVLAISGVVSVILAVDPVNSLPNYLIPFAFIWLYILGRWVVDDPERFLREFLRGVGFLALVATVARVYRLEWTIGDLEIITRFKYAHLRGQILYVADNSLGLLFQAGFVGALGSILVYWKKKRYLVENLIIFALSCSGLVISWSRGAMVSALIGSLFFVIQYSLIGIIGMAGITGILVYFSGERLMSAFNIAKHSTRIKIWMSSLNIVRDHPWFGVGPGNFGRVIEKYRVEGLTTPISCAHSNYLNIFIGWGIIGGAILWGWHLFIFIRAMVKGLTPVQRIIVAILVAYFSHVAINELFAAYSGFLLGLVDHPSFKQERTEEISSVPVC